jgi:hypothetical protein
MNTRTMRTELQAMTDLDRLSTCWTMTTCDDCVIVSATGPVGPVGVKRPTRVEALNATLVALRLARYEASAEKRAA